MTEGIYTGKTVEDATEKGLRELGLTREQADITVLEEGKKKLLRSVPAKVKVSLRKSDGLRAADFLDGLMDLMGIRGVCEVKNDSGTIEIDVQATDPDAVIGRHGETIDAMQCLAGAIANIGRSEYKKVTLDCEGYRKNREKELKELADKLARKAVETGHRISVEPMPSYERRIIHSALMNNPDVKTTSDGREPARYVVIIPNNAREGKTNNGGNAGNKGGNPQGRGGSGKPRGNGGNGNGNGGNAGNGGNKGGNPQGRGGSGKPRGNGGNGNGNGGNGNAGNGGNGNAGNGNGNGGNAGNKGGNGKPRGNGNGNGGERRDRRPDDGNRRPYGGGERRGGSSGSGGRSSAGKKEIHFGTFLGNSRDLENGGTGETGEGGKPATGPEDEE